MTEGEPSSLARFYRAGGAEPRLAEHYRLPAASPALRRSRSIVTEALTPEQCLRAANWLLASSFLSTFAMSLTMQATTEIWLGHFAGDFTRHARRMTSLGTLSSVLGFFIKPLLASLSDAHGRVPLLFLSPSVNLALTTLMAVAPPGWRVPILTTRCASLGPQLCIVLAPPPHSTNGLGVRADAMSAFTYEAQMLVRNACMGDMFSSDSKRLGRQLARMQMVWPLSSIVCPILGGWLTTISLRLPMALSAAVVALSLAVVVPRIPVRLLSKTTFLAWKIQVLR